MKVVFDKTELIAAIAPAASISQVKNTITSVEGLLFECPPDPKMGDFDGESAGMCRISAFDLEKGLRNSLECRIFEEGKCVINGSKILQIVRALPDGDITLEVDSNLRATVSGGASSFEISVNKGEDFPSMPMFKGDRRYRFPQHLIRNMINETIFAAALSDQRVAFNGELLKIKENILTIVGCDGNRLSGVSEELEGDVPECEIIIPAKFMAELSKMIRDSEDEVEMIIGSKHVIFKFDSVYFFCRMIETKYLDYERVIPRSFATEVYLAPAELRDALERASIISEDKLGGNNKAVVKMVFGGGKVDISAVSVSGSIFDSVPAAITGDDVTIGFTCRLLLDALRAVPAEVSRIRIGLNGAEKGVCIEPSYGSTFVKLESAHEAVDASGEEDKVNFLHYVMPRRMNS
ncbi:MAG: DNA polymerase III subunit beta [Clostridia bacterium]|nr:DNA polymerase III subunit beta [Clostridia bacterium]